MNNNEGTLLASYMAGYLSIMIVYYFSSAQFVEVKNVTLEGTFVPRYHVQAACRWSKNTFPSSRRQKCPQRMKHIDPSCRFTIPGDC